MVNTLLTCDAEQQPVEILCAEDERCAQDAPTPQCVPVEAIPCRPSPEPITCEGGLQVMCTEGSGYVSQVPCPDGQICSGDEFPQCLDLVAITCSPQTFPSLCVNGRRIICGVGVGRLIDDGACKG